MICFEHRREDLVARTLRRRTVWHLCSARQRPIHVWTPIHATVSRTEPALDSPPGQVVQGLTAPRSKATTPWPTLAGQAVTPRARRPPGCDPTVTRRSPAEECQTAHGPPRAGAMRRQESRAHNREMGRVIGTIIGAILAIGVSSTVEGGRIFRDAQDVCIIGLIAEGRSE